jgi:hypothetical protein
MCHERVGREFCYIREYGNVCTSCFMSYHPAYGQKKGHGKKEVITRHQKNDKHVDTEVIEFSNFGVEI